VGNTSSPENVVIGNFDTTSAQTTFSLGNGNIECYLAGVTLAPIWDTSDLTQWISLLSMAQQTRLRCDSVIFSNTNNSIANINAISIIERADAFFAAYAFKGSTFSKLAYVSGGKCLLWSGTVDAMAIGEALVHLDSGSTYRSVSTMTALGALTGGQVYSVADASDLIGVGNLPVSSLSAGTVDSTSRVV
jgi:hypothetical protein